MVRVEVGGRPIIDIPGVTVGSSRSTVRRTINNGNKRVQFSWSKVQPRIVVTSDTDEFDEEIMSHFQAEGYQIWYLAYSGDRAAYHNQLQHLADPLEMGDLYAIVGMFSMMFVLACSHLELTLCSLWRCSNSGSRGLYETNAKIVCSGGLLPSLHAKNICKFPTRA